MACDKPVSLLMRLPLEVRHTIFAHAAARDSKPHKLLRRWFEKKEVKELIANHVPNDPNEPAPRAVYNDEEYDDETDSADESEDSEGDEEDEGEDDEEEDEEEEEDEDWGDEEDGEDGQDEDEEDSDDDAEQVDSENEGEEMDVDGTSTKTIPRPPTPIMMPHTKWHHIPKFMCLTHNPPPVELLLTSRQLYNEANDWFYDAAMLRIYPTASFAHTSFFEEALGQISDAAFSPMENIRRVEVVFVWDSTWIRAEETGVVGAVFPALLHQRANFLYKILLQAPDLRELVIHWHDSAQDDESVSLMLDTLAPFHTLPATVKVEEHYIAADAKPRKRSVAGKRRIEFQNIVDMGLERLF